MIAAGCYYTMDVDLDLLRSLLLISNDDGDIDEETLLLLRMTLDEKSVRPPQSIPETRISLENSDDDCCLRRFRFTGAELRELCAGLRLPHRMTSPCRVSWSGMEGLLVVLRRLVYADRFGDI
eukprot:scpid107408/ scgid11316/ 